MSRNNMIFIVILGIAVLASFLMAARNISSRLHDQEEEDNSGNRKGKEPDREDPKVTAAKKELYQYLNQSVKKMYQFYRKDQWDKLLVLGIPSGSVRELYAEIKKTLPEHLNQLLDRYFACLDLDGKPAVEGEEGVEPGTVKDQKELKLVFQKMMLPFYPVYYKEVEELRHTALLSRMMLELFHLLTGKKFRLGYKNRYGNGVTAFRWNKEVFQVFDKEGNLLCDASFQDGKVWDGYAVLPADDYDDEDWELYRKGMWKEGAFVDGTLQYIYKKVCN